eukprot:m.432067 g.432067  ORF g.432067 m.432067 type:complete len:142 (-) comp17384_c0_seq1:114-539(-)
MSLSAGDRKTCAEAFSLYDLGGGKIDARNLGTVMRAPGANPAESDVEKWQAGKTHITEAEYMALMEKQKMHEPAEDCREPFQIFDSEGTGRIDVGELRNVLGNLGERLTYEEIGNMMLMAEVDADGKLSIDDLIAFMAKYN